VQLADCVMLCAYVRVFLANVWETGELNAKLTHPQLPNEQCSSPNYEELIT
jgi:hypothetical protein